MLIHFDISESELSAIDQALLEVRVSELLRAHRKGQHLLVVRRPSAAWLRRELSLNPQDKATLERIEQEATQTGDLLRRARHLTRIVPSGTIHRCDERQVDLPLTFPNFDDVISLPVFIVEDIDDDVELMEFLFQNTARTSTSHPYAYQSDHGGGSGALRVAEARIGDRRIVVMSVDSDKPSPRASDAKLNACSRLQENSNWPFFYFFQTPCRELENFVPMDVAINIQSCRESASFSMLHRNHLAEIQSGTVPPHEAYWLWFDIKDGVCAEQVSRIVDVDTISWLRQKFLSMGMNLDSVSIPGFGKKFVRECLSTPQRQMEFKTAIRSSRWISVFSAYLENFLWLFIAPRPIRT